MTMITQNIDSAFSVITTPPHSLKVSAEYLGARTNGILRKLEYAIIKLLLAKSVFLV